ncbi:MAG: DUF4159 domain-containing protein, partial [Pseudomonadota bacterium]
VVEGARDVRVIGPPQFAEGRLEVTAERLGSTDPLSIEIVAHGLDPVGTPRELARATAEFAAGDLRATAEFDLPPEIRNRVTRFEIDGERSAGAISLTDDSLQRRQVALIAGAAEREGQQLLSPLHYLRQALAPTADLIEGALSDILLASPDVIILADVARLAPDEEAEMIAWVESGGLLVRFAGPRLAASDVARAEAEPLMPVRLREGGRTVGGTMSWGDPKVLQPFAEGSPFFGLEIPEDVVVESQVLAQPDPTLAERTVASLADGTPLVTRRTLGEGSVVLFHVTANADWSSLPLSGLFVQMLERLAVSSRSVAPDADDLAGTIWEAEEVLDGFGTLRDADVMAGVPGEALAEAALSADIPPGLYAGPFRRIARNVIDADTTLSATSWPASVPVLGLRAVAPTDLTPIFLSAAILILMADIIAALALSGRLPGLARASIVIVAVGLAQGAEAQSAAPLEPDDALALLATSEITLAYVVTGDDRVDEISRAGLTGLTSVLWARTSVEPAEPIGVNLETDELAFFPMLYWPITADQPIPSDEAYTRLTAALRGGGMIVFDPRDAEL